MPGVILLVTLINERKTFCHLLRQKCPESRKHPTAQKYPKTQTSIFIVNPACWHFLLSVYKVPGGVWDAQQLLRVLLILAKGRFVGRICVWNVNISQVADPGGHHINNMLLHCWHPTQGYIPAVMGSSWTGVSGRTAGHWQTQRDTPTFPTSLLTVCLIQDLQLLQYSALCLIHIPPCLIIACYYIHYYT